jgi:UDP-N-acetylmuramoyl-tripeptide--D-alanyl-D-alanine ligase
MESLGSRENICLAKLEIVAGMREGGILLYNGDEPLLVDGAPSAFPNLRSFSVEAREGDYRAVNIRQSGEGMLFDLICGTKVHTNVRIPTLGRHNVYNSLAAFAVGNLLGLGEDTIREGLLAFHGADRRQKIYEIGDITVIDDCYNASPESMRAALDVLAAVAASKGQRATALLGDMLELGEYSRLMHDQVGQYAAEKKVSQLFCYGKMADVVAEAAIKRGVRADSVFVSLDTKDPDAMADMILSAVQPGDVLLVKASRGVAAENVIECLKKHFERVERK